MARYRGPKLKIVRRLGQLPGLTRKVARRNYPPGQHGQAGNKSSEYGIQLKEKQKLRYNYGLSERQLLRYVRRARRIKGSTGQTLLSLLEMRLDNVIFRMGIAPTIPAARQLISHGHILVNNKRLNVTSYECVLNDIITIKDKNDSKKLIQSFLELPKMLELPSHLNFDKQKLEGSVQGKADRNSVGLPINELLVIEYYSRKG